MPSRSGGPFATLLMFVPLVAVPLLAVFGVPKFPSLNASPTNGSDDFSFDEPAWETDQPSQDVLAAADSRSRFSRDAPPFRHGTENGEPVGHSNDPFAETPGADWDPPRDALDGWALEPNSDTPPAQSSDAEASLGEPVEADEFAFAAENAAREVPAEPAGELTWQSAVQRLRDCGIDHYQLQPGHQPDLFHFSCLLEPAESPRVIHRFEAESSDPLGAVADVVTQIETFLARR